MAGRRSLPRYEMLADIGGTNARFAALGPNGRISHVRILPTADYASLRDAAIAWLDAAGLAGKIGRGAIAVASPITGDRITLTNRDWSFSTSRLKRSLGLSQLEVVNDFAAVALCVPTLTSRDVLQIGPGKKFTAAPVAILGPGTGLGVSLLVPGDRGWIPVATEGGHVSLPAADKIDAAIIEAMRSRFGHVSAERVLSGPGLADLYTTLAALEGRSVERLEPPEVMNAALNDRDPLAIAAIERFCAFLGTVAGDIALTAGARGGVYIAGGIVPRLGKALARTPFRARFEAKGRFKAYLRDVPTYVVMRDQPAFGGLKNLLRSG